jgi:serine/threonine-protein kinase
MGAVYEAEGLGGGRFAVKVILDAGSRKDTDALRRFVREARTSMSIVSPHVVGVVDADTDAVTSTPFIVMDLLSGTDLDGLIDKVGPLEDKAVARIFRQACEGLSAAHAHAIVHRDIKPANLFLDTSPTGDVIVKVCDFGIAKRTTTDAISPTTAGLTKTGGMLGSPLYMSPEQARNAKSVDVRSDVWSLCVAMYEAICGKTPWAHCTTIGELILAICTEELPALDQVAPWSHPELRRIVHRGLRRPLDERWQTMDELRRALEPLTGGSDLLTASMLVGVSPERRSEVVLAPAVNPHAATVAAPATGGDPSQGVSVRGATTIEGANVARDAPTRSRSPRGLAIALVGALTILGAGSTGVWVVTRRHQAAPPAPDLSFQQSGAVVATALATAVASTPVQPSATKVPEAVATLVEPARSTAPAQLGAPRAAASRKPAVAAAPAASSPRAPTPPSSPQAGQPKLQDSW